MGSHIPMATSYLHLQDDGGRCSRIILVSNDFFFIGEGPYTTLASCWGALRWGVHGSQFFNVMDVSGSSTHVLEVFFCFELSCCNKFGWCGHAEALCALLQRPEFNSII
jgi:hypothetical protein